MFAGDVIARLRKGVDGKTTFELECGQRWAGNVAWSSAIASS